MKIVLFTDCMSIGPLNVDANLRYPGLMEIALEGYDIEIRGDSGATTHESVPLIDDIVEMKPDIVVYGYGINDALPRGLYRHQRSKLIRTMFKLNLSQKNRLRLRKYFLNPLEYIMQIIGRPKQYLTRDEMTSNIRQCIQAFKENNISVVIVNLAPVYNYRFRNATKWISKYNESIASLCQEENVQLVDVFTEFEKIKNESLADDSFHYGMNGHKIAADLLIKCIRELERK